MKIKMTKGRRLRIAATKEWLKGIDKSLSFVELKRLYKKKFKVDNACIYRDLAALGYEEAIVKVKNIEESNKQRALKRKKKIESDSFFEYDLYELNMNLDENDCDYLLTDDYLPF